MESAEPQKQGLKWEVPRLFHLIAKSQLPLRVDTDCVQLKNGQNDAVTDAEPG